MVENYDIFKPVYESIKKTIKTFPFAMPKKDIFWLAESLGIKVESSEERSLLDGLEKYFLKFKILTHEAKAVKAGIVVSFEKMSKEEEKHAAYFDAYKSLGKTLSEYILEHEEYAINVNDIIIYVNKIMPKDIEKVPTGTFFLEGLRQYLSDRPDLYIPLEAERPTAGVEMETKRLISMETGKSIGHIAIFSEIR